MKFILCFVCLFVGLCLCAGHNEFQSLIEPFHKYKKLSYPEKEKLFEDVMTKAESFILGNVPAIQSFASCLLTNKTAAKKNEFCDLSTNFLQLHNLLEDHFHPVESHQNPKLINKRENALEPSQLLQLPQPANPNRSVRTNYEAMALLGWGLAWTLEFGMGVSDFIGWIRGNDFSTSGQEEAYDPDLIYEKWATIRAALPTFAQWRSVWGKPQNGIESEGGVNQICADWLRLAWGPGKTTPPTQYSTAWKQIFNKDNIPSRFTSQNTAAIKGCTIYSKDKDCVAELRKLKQKRADNSKKKEGLDAAETVEEYGFYLTMIENNIQKYFAQPAPSSRVSRYVFGPENDNSYVLPDDDLKMCWTIMDTAIRTKPEKQASTMSIWKALSFLLTYGILFVSALRIGLIYLVVGVQKVESVNCVLTQYLFDPNTMASLSCTDDNHFGSVCFVTCLPEYGTQFDGIARQLFATCLGPGGWSFPNLPQACLRQPLPTKTQMVLI